MGTVLQSYLRRSRDDLCSLLAEEGVATNLRICKGIYREPPELAFEEREAVRESFLDLIDGKTWQRDKPLVWEHEGNCAVRSGEWKLVRRFPERWELYDMSEDRTELHDLAPHDAPRVARMAALHQEWVAETGVAPWPVARLGPNVFWGGGYGMRPWLAKGPPSL